MPLLSVVEMLGHCLVLIYGVLLSTQIAGGWHDRRQRLVVAVLCPILLLAQGVCWHLLGVERVRQLYPLIVHLPLVLVMMLCLKKNIEMAIASVCTAYLLCQLPRWLSLLISSLTSSALAGACVYLPLIIAIYVLLNRYFVRAAHDAMSSSVGSLRLFGSLPAAYYLFDYAISVYDRVPVAGMQAVQEFLPTALIAFYVMFLAAYHVQAQKRSEAELQRSMLEAELKQSAAEIETLRRVEIQTGVYQHDVRHHLSAIDSFLAAGKQEQARAYIAKVQAHAETVMHKRYCRNELVNLLCSSFEAKCCQKSVRLTVEATLPEKLTISDTELCALLSNGLENALNAVSDLPDEKKWISLYCGIRLNKLLLEIRNPYEGGVSMRDGLPVSDREEHGYGCRSIRSIAEKNRGLCTFEPENGIFALRVVLPFQET